jgi:hypothetical protein
MLFRGADMPASVRGVPRTSPSPADSFACRVDPELRFLFALLIAGSNALSVWLTGVVQAGITASGLD